MSISPSSTDAVSLDGVLNLAYTQRSYHVLNSDLLSQRFTLTTTRLTSS